MSDAGNPHPSTGLPALSAPPPAPKPPSALGCVVVPVILAVAVVVAVIIAAVATSGHDESSATTLPTTEAAAPRSAPPAPTGDEFRGPDGAYSLTVDPVWTQLSGTTVPTWAVAEPVDGFAPNVNVATQPAPELTLAQYVDASVASLSGFDVVDTGLVDTDHGQVGLIEYVGTPDGAPGELRFLAVLGLGDDHAAVATFTAPADSFEVLREAVEPYLLTLDVS